MSLLQQEPHALVEACENCGEPRSMRDGWCLACGATKEIGQRDWPLGYDSWLQRARPWLPLIPIWLIGLVGICVRPGLWSSTEIQTVSSAGVAGTSVWTPALWVIGFLAAGTLTYVLAPLYGPRIFVVTSSRFNHPLMPRAGSPQTSLGTGLMRALALCFVYFAVLGTLVGG